MLIVKRFDPDRKPDSFLGWFGFRHNAGLNGAGVSCSLESCPRGYKISLHTISCPVVLSSLVRRFVQRVLGAINVSLVVAVVAFRAGFSRFQVVNTDRLFQFFCHTRQAIVFSHRRCLRLGCFGLFQQL